MNGVHNGGTYNPEKPFPGCLGRMVNLFDMSTGAPGNRMLMDKPHCDGSPLSRSRSDVSGMSPTGEHIEDIMIVSDLRRASSNRKPNATPIKMLIAQEMSKEVDSKQKPTSIVAKLMGLDALPQQQPDSASQRSHSRNSSRSHSGMSMGYWQKEHGVLDMERQHETHQYLEQNDYKDVYEIWQSHDNHVGGKSSERERLNGSSNEKDMALIRQNFTDLKRLATDEKLRQSKQFQDALEVLSSNKDLFLQFLQEPNSMFSHHLYDLQSIPPPETKRITVLRPAKMVDDNNFAKSGPKSSKFGDVQRWDKSNARLSPPSRKVEDSRTQATRIVVLKPSPGKSHDFKAVASPRALDVDGPYEEPEDVDAQESREVAKEITRQMRESLTGHRRDETLLSSVFSNGYNGDESSFNKSENEYVVENLSDSEVLSPTSKHSWDYINRTGSPYSFSSFSRASYSPESSVCREAKKRLSERWAMMASNSSAQEQRHMRRSSSTLGEMLAISDVKNSAQPGEDISNIGQKPRLSTSCLASDSNCKDKGDTTYPTNLLRSKSVPLSSTANGFGIGLDVSDPKVEKTENAKEEKKASAKFSLKGRVSSLFFSKNKKSSKEKPNRSTDEMESAVTPSRNYGSDVNLSEYGSGLGLELNVLPDMRGSSTRASPSELFGTEPKLGMLPYKAGFTSVKPCANGNPNDNQEQPSPSSVLQPHFEEDEHRVPEFFNNIRACRNGLELPVNTIKGNLIDKSPPIGSISRTLSWGDSCTETATPSPLRSSMVPKAAEEDREEWFSFVQTLLATAGLDGEVQSHEFLDRWHSLESPLDPSLRDKYIDLNDKAMPHEAKRRQRRSTRKLVFDCVNAALIDIAGYGSNTCQRATACGVPHDRLQNHTPSKMVDLVWAEVKELFSDEVRCFLGDSGDINSLVVETVVRKEVVGKGWVEQLRSEKDNFAKEIECKLLEELLQEAMEELTGGV